MREVLNALYRAVKSPRVRSIVETTGQDPDDIVQTAILRSLAKQKGVTHVEGEERRGAYAYVAVRTIAIDGARRANKRRGRLVEIDDASVRSELPSPAPSPFDVLVMKRDAEEKARHLRWIVAASPYEVVPELKQALVRVAEGESYSAVAREMNVATSTLTRARDRIMDRIKERQGSPQLSLFTG